MPYQYRFIADTLGGNAEPRERCPSQQTAMNRIIRSNNPARNDGIFIECVDGAQSMISIGNDGLTMSRIPEQQEWRDRLLQSDESAISIHMNIGAAEQR